MSHTKSLSGHTTVLLDEAVDLLVQSRTGHYVDGTFGRGGHSRLILSRLAESGRLTGIDKDPEAVAAGNELMASDRRFAIRHGSFADIAKLASSGLDGLLLDLGVSSPQLDDPARGFSFLRDGPLDMRMNPHSHPHAAEWLATVPQAELADVLKRFGDERFARRIATAIVAARQEIPIERTAQLAKIVADAHPAWPKRVHPATKTFQAIRIFINSELVDLQKVLDESVALLRPGGRLVVISFHSLEDRIVKRFMRRHERGQDLASWVAVTEDMLDKKLKRVGKGRRALADEIEDNPRARSAVMRVAERL